MKKTVQKQTGRLGTSMLKKLNALAAIMLLASCTTSDTTPDTAAVAQVIAACD